MSERQIFTKLQNCKRVWAIASVHGQADQLFTLHDRLGAEIDYGDRLVYLGNLLGHGPKILETLDEVLRFRREIMAVEPADEDHVAILRGSQEEMWQKLMQLQFATDPTGVIEWMLKNGVGATLKAYRSSPEEARAIARSGPVSITRWTQSLRQRMQSHPGHYELLGALRRAALTEGGELLFVNAGLDQSRPLETQRDSFWWADGSFSKITSSYAGFLRVVRGFDKTHPGLEEDEFRISLDGGCGFDGPLLAAALRLDGSVERVVEAPK